MDDREPTSSDTATSRPAWNKGKIARLAAKALSREELTLAHTSLL